MSGWVVGTFGDLDGYARKPPQTLTSDLGGLFFPPHMEEEEVGSVKETGLCFRRLGCRATDKATPRELKHASRASAYTVLCYTCVLYGGALKEN